METPYIFSAALFYAQRAILCFSNFRHGQAWHHRCGSKDMGQPASLLAWLPHGSRPTAPLGAEACPWFSFSFRFKYQNNYVSWTLWPLGKYPLRLKYVWDKQFTLLPLRRGRSCAGPRIMSQPFYKYVEQCLCAGTRPALRSADLAGK